MKVFLIGIGPGASGGLTAEAKNAIDMCPVLIGAKRMLEPYRNLKECVELIASEEIVTYIKSLEIDTVGVLLSGDVGFYSGANRLRDMLDGYAVESIAGLSSLAYLCAKLGMAWQDAHIVSAHGREHNAAGEIQSHGKTFLLTGGMSSPSSICRDLCEWGMRDVRIWVGENLSYPEERIVSGIARDFVGSEFSSLSVLLAINPAPVLGEYAVPAITDTRFLRGDVPMTKEEVRALVISKLRLKPRYTVWDIGAGTGSVSVECALCCTSGRVFAVEMKEEALELIQENKKQFGASNLHVVAGKAPDVLVGLPVPDRVFFGGTSGNLESILEVCLSRNPALRAVAAAVTLETLSEAVRCFEKMGLGDIDISEISVTKIRKAGGYHMMNAQNPVWLISGEGRA